jgi:hypothetical protein
VAKQVSFTKAALPEIRSILAGLREFEGDKDVMYSLIWHTNERGDINSRRIGFASWDKHRLPAGFLLFGRIGDVEIFADKNDFDPTTHQIDFHENRLVYISRHVK